VAVCVLRIISNITTIFLNDEFSYKSSVSKYLSKMIHWWRAKAAIRPDEIGGPFRGSSFHIVPDVFGKTKEHSSINSNKNTIICGEIIL